MSLDGTHKFYQVVKKLFLSGIAPRAGAGGAAITAVHKVAQGPRSRAFQLQGQLLAAARGAGGGNAKFAWYGAPSPDLAAAVEHGFGKTNSQVLGPRAHGNGGKGTEHKFAGATVGIIGVDLVVEVDSVRGG